MTTAEPWLTGSELATFAAAIEAGTISGAADTLNLTQSAATKRLRSLERRVGAALLRRHALGVVPTELGRLLYPEAKQVLAALAGAQQAVSGYQAGSAVPLRLAASQTIGEFVLPAWLAEFRLADGAGAARVELGIANSPRVLSEVRAGDVDVGFVEGLDALDGLDVLRLLRDEIVVVVAQSHPWTRRERPVDVRELEGVSYLTREQGSGTRAVAEAALRAVGVLLTPQLEVASTQSLKRAVRDGGFTLISRLAIESSDAELAVVDVQGVDLRRDLCAVRRTCTGGRPAVASRFWGSLRAR